VAVIAASLFAQVARLDLVLSYWLLGCVVRSPRRRESELWCHWMQDLSISTGMDFLWERIQCLENFRLEKCERPEPELSAIALLYQTGEVSGLILTKLVQPDFLGLETFPCRNQGPHCGVRYYHWLTTDCLRWRTWGVDSSAQGVRRERVWCYWSQRSGRQSTETDSENESLARWNSQRQSSWWWVLQEIMGQ